MGNKTFGLASRIISAFLTTCAVFASSTVAAQVCWEDTHKYLINDTISGPRTPVKPELTPYTYVLFDSAGQQVLFKGNSEAELLAKYAALYEQQYGTTDCAYYDSDLNQMIRYKRNFHYTNSEPYWSVDNPNLKYPHFHLKAPLVFSSVPVFGQGSCISYFPTEERNENIYRTWRYVNIEACNDPLHDGVGIFRVMVQKTRDLDCPAGTSKEFGQHFSTCVRKHQPLGEPQYCPVGNPINHGTGNKYQQEIDFRAHGRDPIPFQRTYNSLANTDGPMGRNWVHNYETSAKLSLLDSSEIVEIQRADGKKFTATRFDDSDKFIIDGDNDLSIVISGDRLVLVEPGEVRQEYDLDSGLLVGKSRPGGISLEFIYDGQDRLTSVTNSANRTLNFSYSSDGLLLVATNAIGESTHYEYDDQRRLISVKYPDQSPEDLADNPTVQYLYENVNFPNALTGRINELGVRSNTWEYDSQGRAISSELAGGLERVELDYVSENRTTVRKASGLVTHYNFENIAGIRQLISTEGEPDDACQGRGVANVYDSRGNLISKTDKNGVTTSYSYDSKNRIIRVTAAIGAGSETTTNIEWHPTLSRPTVLKSGDVRKELLYDSRGNLLSKTVRSISSGKAATSTFTYDELGRLIETDGPALVINDVSNLQYDANGDLALITDSLGNLVNHEYDGLGRLVRKVTADGRETIRGYDARGNLTQLIQNGFETSFGYDASNRLIGIVDERGILQSHVFDEAGRFLSSTDDSGEQLQLTLDAAGRVISSEKVAADSSVLNSEGFSYDEYGRILSTTTSSGIRTYSYDFNNNLLEMTDERGGKWAFVYDALNRTIETIDPLLESVKLVIDSNGRIQEVVSELAASFSLAFGIESNFTSENSADRGAIQYDRDPSGLITAYTDANGARVSLTYDDGARVSTIVSNDEEIRYSYLDNQSDSYSTSIIQNNLKTEFSYNTNRQQTSRSQTIDGNTYLHGLAYVGRDVSEETYPSGMKVRYGRDQRGRIVSIEVDNGSGFQNVISGIIYKTNLGRPILAVMGNGIVWSQTVDSQERISGLEWSGKSKIDFEFDPTGNVQSEIDSVRGISSTYQYDLKGRLTRHEADGKARSLSYDAADNILSSDDGGTSYTIGYQSKSNRMSSITKNGIALAVSLDANGNTLALGNLALTMNGLDRVASVKRGDEELVEYSYDYANLRIKREQAGSVTHFQYNQRQSLIGEYDSDGSVKREYIYLGAQPVAMVIPGAASEYDYELSLVVKNPKRLTRNINHPGRAKVGLDVAAKTLDFEDDKGGKFTFGFEGELDKFLVKDLYRRECIPAGELSSIDADGFNLIVAGNKRCKKDGVRILGSWVKYRIGKRIQFRNVDAGGKLLVGNILLDTNNAIQKSNVWRRSADEFTYSAKALARRKERLQFLCDRGKPLDEIHCRELASIQDGTGYKAHEFIVESIREGVASDTSAPQLAFIHSDHLLRPILMTDQSGKTIWEARYDALGKADVRVEEQSLNLRAPGQYYDSESGLHYNHNRFYFPDIGRYIQSDPKGIDGGLNTYLYANGNPMRFVDPRGESALELFSPLLYIRNNFRFEDIIPDHLERSVDLANANVHMRHCVSNCRGTIEGVVSEGVSYIAGTNHEVFAFADATVHDNYFGDLFDNERGREIGREGRKLCGDSSPEEKDRYCVEKCQKLYDDGDLAASERSDDSPLPEPVAKEIEKLKERNERYLKDLVDRYKEKFGKEGSGTYESKMRERLKHLPGTRIPLFRR